MILIGLVTFFHVELSDHRNINWFLSYIQKFMKKIQKIGFTRNTIISKTKEDFELKIWHNYSKTGNHIVLTFQVCLF